MLLFVYNRTIQTNNRNKDNEQSTQSSTTQSSNKKHGIVYSSNGSIWSVGCWRSVNATGCAVMNSALKRKLRKQHRDTVLANVLGFATLVATVAAIYVINYQIILIRYGA